MKCPSRRDNERRKWWNDNLVSTELHTDSMGLVKAVRLGLVQSLSSRRRRDILDLRECMVKGELSVMMHIDGKTNLSDIGTKKSDKTQDALPALIELVMKGLYYPKQSLDYERTFVNVLDGTRDAYHGVSVAELQQN